MSEFDARCQMEPGQHGDPRWQWWALHGGAGVSSLAQLEPRGEQANLGVFSPDGWTVMVCRTSAAGLLAAKRFASGLWQGSSKVVGLVTVADAPGRLPAGLRQLRRHVTGGYHYAWHVPWVEAWRCGEPVSAETAPRAVRAVMAQIANRVANIGPEGLPSLLDASTASESFCLVGSEPFSVPQSP